MENILKKPYEISLWEDVLVFVVTRADGVVTEYEGSIPEDAIGSVTAQYYKEKKICIIGSDTMSTPVRATASKLVSKVNGENILTFNLHSHYYDEDTETLCNNPYVGLLINERKVKLRYGALGASDTKWYDLIIKNIQENSSTKTYTYTAKDLYVNELSKSGFNLVLDAELENNMGNVTTLAEVILDESDWQLKEGSDILQQRIQEPLYKIQLNQPIDAKNMEDNNEKLSLAAGKFIYAFYNNIVNQQPYLQFLYAEEYELNDDSVITNSPNWFIEKVTYSNEGLPAFAAEMAISSEYRGERIVRKVQTKYDATIDKYVSVYNDGTQDIYGFTETDYASPATVRSFVTNPNSYDTYDGWEVGGANVNESVVFPELKVVSVPDVRDVPYEDIIGERVTFTSCLKFTTTNTNQVLYNSGIVDHRHHIEGFAEKDKYVFRVKYGVPGVMGAHGAQTLIDTDINLTLSIRSYTLEEGVYVFGDTYFEGTIDSKSTNSATNYVSSGPIECLKALSYEDMTKMGNNLGLFIKMQGTGTIYIEDVQFFAYVDNNGSELLPDEIAQGKVITTYYYYIPSKEYTKIEDVKFIYKGETPASYAEKYNDNAYEKIRSITASESNRFNLLQELCEVFECWVKFEIEHDAQTGEVILDKNYRPKKWVSFHEYVGQDNYAGFKYGINLKSIQRTVESEAIVSKMIVKDNSNEFATDGFCSIARASENPSGENFLLDFSYYIQQGLLGLAEVTNDLYLDSTGYLGYYKKLRRINNKRDKYIDEQSGLLADLSTYQAQFQTYSLSVSEAKEQLKDKYIYIEKYTGYSFQVLMANQELKADKSNKKIVDWWDDSKVQSAIASIGRLQTVIKNHQKLATTAESNLTAAQDRFNWLNRALTSKEATTDVNEERLLIEKEELNRAYYKKYSRFLQEGPWISEDYIDDNLYFLDAQSTLHTSSQPKVTYDITVLELSQIEGYKNYTFALGDKTTMEDTEFFGWTFVNGIQTPYKEEIVVTELTIVLDSPEQNQIKVQNFKTQFEDLFQRMAATTQSVEYSTGQYKKVSGIVETDGTINIVTLQNSIANNALTLQNAKDQSVVWDETGITTTSLSNPAEIVRIVSGGIFLSADGGVTWNTGVTGKGINASYLTSGQVNTEQVNIMNGAFSSFRWDKAGISAYEFDLNKQTGEVANFNFSKFIRFDQYGLYGIDGFSNFESAVAEQDGTVGEDKIWKYSNFALTWRGFQLKSKHTEGGYISITSDRDFEVVNSAGVGQVKIGLLYNETTPIYGIQLKDTAGQIVMENGSDGKIWIRDKLNIGLGNSKVAIGQLEDTKWDAFQEGYNPPYVYPDDESIHQVFNANNKFLIFEDGSMKATDGHFTGTVHATGGTIGNLEIDEIENSIAATKKLDIEAKFGYNYRVDGGVPTPSKLHFLAKPIGFEIPENQVVNWLGSSDFITWTGLTDEEGNGKIGLEIEFSYDEFNSIRQDSMCYLKAMVADKNNEVHEAWFIVSSSSDSDDPIILVITANNGTYFRNNQGETTLYAKLLQAGREVDENGTQYTYTWYDTSKPTEILGTQKTIKIKADQVSFSATIGCDIGEKE